LTDRHSAAGRRDCTKVSRPAAAESSRVVDRAPSAAGSWAPPQAPKRRPVSCSALLGGARAAGASLAAVTPGQLGTWRPGSSSDAARWLRVWRGVWWLAGGWALDEFLGGPTRHHDDLDVGCLRRDLPDALRALTSWEWSEAREGELVRLAIGSLPRTD